MRAMRFLPLGALCALLFTGAGCQYPGERFDPHVLTSKTEPVMQTVSMTNLVEPAWLKPSTQPFTLGPGDRLEIEIIGEVASKVITVVGPDGKIYFSLLP